MKLTEEKKEFYNNLSKEDAKDLKTLKECISKLQNLLGSTQPSYHISAIEGAVKSCIEKRHNKNFNKFWSATLIENDIILATIDCDNIEEVITKIKDKLRSNE